MDSLDGVDRAREIFAEESGSSFLPGKRAKRAADIIAFSWAVFHLALAGFLVMDQLKVRAIHLAFALALVFLLFPFRRRSGKRFFSTQCLLTCLGVVSALYIIMDYQGLASRAGIPMGRDLLFGCLLVVLVLEGARRVVGPALSIIAIIFTLYAFFGPYFPDILAFKGVSLTKYVSNISLSSEGIYGIPLGVSAAIVFLFVLLGAIMERAGAGKFFTDCALSLLGRFRGGAAKAAVVASGATGLVSGSSIANIVTTGPFTIPLMKKIGYPAKKAAAIEVAASTDGQLMPPIMGAAAFIIAEYVNVPYIQVVKAAIIPAVASYFGLFCIAHLEAAKLGIRGLTKDEVPDFFKTFKNGAHFLLPLFLLGYELVVLRHSPEMAAFRAILMLALVVVYQEIKKAWDAGKGWRSGGIAACKVLFEGMVAGSRSMVAVALACAAAGIIVGVVNMGIGGMIALIVETMAGGNLYLLLLITALASLLIGMGLPTTATYIVMASLTAPIIVEVGGVYGFVVPVMAAHLFCFYFGILADDTPPVGLAAYAAAAIAESKPIPTGIQGFLYDIRTSVIAFLFVLNPELILHGVHSWWQGLLIFSMAIVAMSAFENVMQGWCLDRNRWYEVPFFLAAALILFYPGLVHTMLPDVPNKYLFFPLGIILYLFAILLQSMRRMKRHGP